MPIHRIPRATLDEDVKDIERKQGERVVSITPDTKDPEFYFVLTEAQGVETRAAQ